MMTMITREDFELLGTMPTKIQTLVTRDVKDRSHMTVPELDFYISNLAGNPGNMLIDTKMKVERIAERILLCNERWLRENK